MAKKEVVQVIDDLDGKVLDEYETVQWSLDGRNYEFDTSTKHAQQFRDAFEKYISISRVTSRTGRRGPVAKGGARRKHETQAIREWAVDNGYDVSDRGRIPHSILEAYEAAH